jgi:hypothetical protein
LFTTQADFSIKHFETANILVDNVTIKNDLVAGNSQINAQDYSIEEQHARVRLEALLLKKRELQVELENITQSNMEKMEIKPEEGKNYTNYVKGALIVAILAIIVLGIWTVFRRTPPDGNEPGDNAMSRELSSVPVSASSDNTSLTFAYASSGPAETGEAVNASRLEVNVEQDGGKRILYSFFERNLENLGSKDAKAMCHAYYKSSFDLDIKDPIVAFS